MRKIAVLLLTSFALHALAFGQTETSIDNSEKGALEEHSTSVDDSMPLGPIQTLALVNLEIPKVNPKDKVITHTGFSFVYNESHEQATWVAYQLTKTKTHKLFNRTDKFMPDSKVKTYTANDKDYAGSGYDRGHLAPAADMGWSFNAMAESFLYSNMSPQTPSFNRGVWKRLEELARQWAIENDTIYIITGPVLTAGLPVIGPNKVSVPKYFYKVILDYTEPGIKGIGFLIPNSSSIEPLQRFAVTIDSVEKFTGIDFCPTLPDEQEDMIEKTLCVKCWNWKMTPSNPEKNKSKTTTSFQCNGLTKTGDRCKNTTVNTSGFCNLHEYQEAAQDTTGAQSTETERRATSVQCSGTTKAGNRCKHMTYSPNGFCFQHGGD